MYDRIQTENKKWGQKMNKKNQMKNIKFSDNLLKNLILPILVLVVAVVFAVTLGFNKGLDFQGGIIVSVMADETAKIILKPTQYIKSIPNTASHSASLYKINDNQIDYLRGAGLSSEQVKQVLQEAFLSQN